MSATVRIGSHTIGPGHPVFVIAEIGVNHNGKLEIAKQLVDVAVQAGANAVKFQRRALAQVYSASILQNPNLGEQSFTYLLPFLKELELSDEAYQEIVRYCQEKGIMFLCTPWDADSVGFLERLGVPAYKVGSADLTNLLLIERLIQTEKPLILSTGMARFEEIAQTAAFLNERKAQYILLHCNSTYPAPFEEVNLRCLESLRQFGAPVGYSGHERGIAVSAAAVALGACVIERHITLDRTMVGPDHAASLEPQGFIKQVRDIRHIEQALGDGVKRMTQGEVMNREVLGKSLVAARDIAKGAVITREMVSAKSPGKFLSPQRVGELLGRTAIRDVKADEPFTVADVGQATVLKPIDGRRLPKRWGLKARFHDLDALLIHQPTFFELHLTDKDLEVPFRPAARYRQALYVHAPEYRFRTMIDLCSPDAQIRESSIEIIQQTLEKTRELAAHFTGSPTVILHVGGASLEPIADTKPLLAHLLASLRRLDTKGIEVLLENLPPRPWFFGGQWVCNVFVEPEEIRDFCTAHGFGHCFDTSHAQLYCNFAKRPLKEYMELIRPITRHLHISDAAGIDGEGLQIGEGNVDFAEVFRTFQGMDCSLVPEIWRGHQNLGEGFVIAFERLAKYFEDAGACVPAR